MCIDLHFSDEFYVFADIRTTQKGFPRLQFNGYTYGRRFAKQDTPTMSWICTRLGANSKKRCLARLETNNVNGHAMVRVQNSNHTCISINKN